MADDLVKSSRNFEQITIQLEDPLKLKKKPKINAKTEKKWIKTKNQYKN